MRKKVMALIIALAGIYSIGHILISDKMNAASAENIGKQFTMGGEAFKVVQERKGAGPDGTDLLTALLMRFTETNVKAGNGYFGCYAGCSDTLLATYAKKPAY